MISSEISRRTPLGFSYQISKGIPEETISGIVPGISSGIFTCFEYSFVRFLEIMSGCS